MRISCFWPLACVTIASISVLFAALPALAQTAEDIKARNAQAVQLYHQGKVAEAFKLTEETVALAEKGLGPDHPDTLETINNLGLLHGALGRRDEEERLYKQALAGYERTLGPEHPSTLLTVNNLATHYQGRGRYVEAEALHRRALAGYEKALGPEDPSTLLSMNNVAAFYQELGRYAEAEALFKRAIPGYERALGPEHADTLRAVNNLGTLYREQGRYGEAEPLYKRALAGYEKTLGPEGLLTLISVNNLSNLYLAQSRYGEAGPLAERAVASFEKLVGPEHSYTLMSVTGLANVREGQGRYGEAEPLYRRALASHEKQLGPQHPLTLRSINNLSVLYQRQGRYKEAEPLLNRALAGFERTLGPEHQETLINVNNVGALYENLGRYEEAEAFYKRALAGRRKVLGPNHSDTLQSMNNLGLLYMAQGRFPEAEPLLKQALAEEEKAWGPNHPETLLSVNNLAQLYEDQGRYDEARQLLERAMAGVEKALGPDHPQTLSIVANLGGIWGQQGRHNESERLHKRALEGSERVLGAEHRDTLVRLSNLAALYGDQHRFRDAEPLLERAFAGFEKVLGPEHPDTIQMISNLAGNYAAQNRLDEAEPLYKRALDGFERRRGPEHPSTLLGLNNLAANYERQGRYDEAEPLFKRALAGYEKVLGPEHPATLRSVNNLAVLYNAQGKQGEAEALHKRALQSSEQALGPEHPATLRSVSNLAFLHFTQGDWQQATQLWRRSTAARARRVQRGVLDTGLTGKKQNEAAQKGGEFLLLLKAAYRLAPEGRNPEPSTSAEMFHTAQWALSSEAAQSLAQMAARGTKGDPALAAALRERQDLVDEWQRREKVQAAALGQEVAKRNARAEADNRERMAAIDKRISEMDAVLRGKFPEYTALASPAPLTVAEVQVQLAADEALVMFLDTRETKPTPEETFVWVVTKTDARWARSDLGKSSLTREVQALRCGLDYTAWKGSRCRELTGADYSLPLPFDHARAHRLYKALFGEVEDLVKDKTHLLVVPSGALTQLPFQVLITAPPAAGNHRKAAWLARSHALTVLPAVSSLKALRTTAQRSLASKILIGFGNPLLDGPDDRYAKAAKLARDKQICPKSAWERVASLVGLRNNAAPVEARGGLADVSLIRMQVPLPETADELCAVARDVGADLGEIRLGAQATEHAVKAMSEAGQLANYRIVHFATHGLTAGQLSTTAEPGLILTPPAEPTADDDGYLSASEIAALRLDADWVILSACNTAAGDASSAEALSGLARAFIYAQARALLVSHWEVYSDATVKLITTAMRQIARDRSVGRAEALRRAMLALIDKGTPDETHPAFWAPFVVVGADGKQTTRLASVNPAARFTAPAPISGAPSPATPAMSTTAAEPAAPIEQPGAEAVEPAPVLVTMPLPVRAPSVKERRAAIREEARRKSRYEPAPTSAWKELFSR